VCGVGGGEDSRLDSHSDASLEQVQGDRPRTAGVVWVFHYLGSDGSEGFLHVAVSTACAAHHPHVGGTPRPPTRAFIQAAEEVRAPIARGVRALRTRRGRGRIACVVHDSRARETRSPVSQGGLSRHATRRLVSPPSRKRPWLTIVYVASHYTVCARARGSPARSPAPDVSIPPHPPELAAPLPLHPHSKDLRRCRLSSLTGA
jgi:hypothetical protein